MLEFAVSTGEGAEQRATADLGALPDIVKRFPQLRYMGSKYKLLPWIHSVLCKLEFGSALDAFSGSCCVGYMMKAMGKRVVSNDFLNLGHEIGKATIENNTYTLRRDELNHLLRPNPSRKHFIENTFKDIFFNKEDLQFLDNIWANLRTVRSPYASSLVLASLLRSCVKRQPRGVFTVAGSSKYDDGRRDLRLSLKEHFIESLELYNSVVFDNGFDNRALRSDIFDVDPRVADLAYFDPPYVPRADDNCYIKRYHFLEGLTSYWEGPGTEIVAESMVKKIAKRFTPFSYRRTAVDAFDRLFGHFRQSILVLSYSSNGFPDLAVLVDLMRKYKSDVAVFEKSHRYHFGTHSNVSAERAVVREYLIVGS
jgi:DNA adenine methylase/adenine-specific DNA-methyltransferase